MARIEFEGDEPLIVMNSETGIGSSSLLLPGEVLPTTLHLLPLSTRPFFPAQVMPILASIDEWVDTIKRIEETSHHLVGLCLVDSDDPDAATPDQFFDIGTVVHMHHPNRIDGRPQFIAEGLQRFRIVKWISKKSPLWCRFSNQKLPPS